MNISPENSLAPLPTKKLQHLTPEQEAHLPVLRDKWLQIGLSTEPGDHAKAEDAVRRIYVEAGLKPPPRIIWNKSPFEGAIAATMLPDPKSLDGFKFLSPVLSQIKSQVSSQVESQVLTQVKSQAESQFWSQVGSQFWSQVGSALVGPHNAGLWSFYDTFRVFGITECDRLSGHMELAKHCGWWWPFNDTAIITEKPCRLMRDDQNRLHSGDGMAIAYPDGFGVYSWHGVRLPEKVIMHPELLTPAEIFAEHNVEIRRVMIDRFGADRLMSMMNPKVLDKDTDSVGKPRRLLRIDLEGDEPIIMVEVTNSTAEHDGTWKNYLLRVPPHVRTCQSAVAWTFNVMPQRYHPRAET